LFDVDGTLTPSRKKINSSFALWFLYFSQHNAVSLVTGSDNPKTLEQIGPEICMSVNKIYNCNGNDVWLKDFLEKELANSSYEVKTGNHIEERPGMVNFSIVGRNADKVQRKNYFYYDIESDERIHIAEKINKQFEDVSAVVGGETGIDIIAKGKDKRQVLDEIKEDRVFFFGDRMDPDGNDFSLAYAVKEAGGVAKQVKSWRDTKEILENFQQRGIAK
jgi:phosphomannomutase